jgi:hypothetical protein
VRVDVDAFAMYFGTRNLRGRSMPVRDALRADHEAWIAEVQQWADDAEADGSTCVGSGYKPVTR